MNGRELGLCLGSLRWSQAKFARKLGVDPHTVGRWKNNADGEVPEVVAAYVALALRLKDVAEEVLG